MEYKKITKKKLKEIIKSHKLWLAGNPNGIKADLVGMDLSGLDLSRVDLSYADLHNANLQDVNLSYAVLNYAVLNYANLCYADLCGADLSNANLKNADLNSANLSSTSLYCANLCYADLSNAVLINTDLEGANLFNAYLYNREYYTSFDTTDDLLFRTGRILTKPMIGYKKCMDNVIVTLEIPEGAVVFSINGCKCRTNKVKVLAVDGANEGISFFNNDVSYRVDDNITVNDFDCAYNAECANGIHFFVSREAAEKY